MFSTGIAGQGHPESSYAAVKQARHPANADAAFSHLQAIAKPGYDGQPLKSKSAQLRFLGLHTYSEVPDSSTIWHFRERLKEGNVVQHLFKRFKKELDKQQMIVHKGKIVDASVVQAPRQSNTREENQSIKDGVIPESWSGKKKSHKDIEARWVTKNRRHSYGYKNHIAKSTSKWTANPNLWRPIA